LQKLRSLSFFRSRHWDNMVDEVSIECCRSLRTFSRDSTNKLRGILNSIVGAAWIHPFRTECDKEIFIDLEAALLNENRCADILSGAWISCGLKHHGSAGFEILPDGCGS